MDAKKYYEFEGNKFQLPDFKLGGLYFTKFDLFYFKRPEKTLENIVKDYYKFGPRIIECVDLLKDETHPNMPPDYFETFKAEAEKRVRRAHLIEMSKHFKFMIENNEADFIPEPDTKSESYKMAYSVLEGLQYDAINIGEYLDFAIGVAKDPEDIQELINIAMTKYHRDK